MSKVLVVDARGAVGRAGGVCGSVLAVAVLAPGVASAKGGGGIIDPGQGIAPPGSAQLTTLVGYVAWAVFALCVVGVLVAAAQMAVSHHRGGGAGEHAARLGWVLSACVLAGSASALVGALV
jgi:hypothetical protein